MAVLSRPAPLLPYMPSPRGPVVIAGAGSFRIESPWPFGRRLGRNVNPALLHEFGARFTFRMKAEVLPCETIALPAPLLRQERRVLPFLGFGQRRDLAVLVQPVRQML